MFSFLAKKSLNADLATRADSAARADTATWAASATNAGFAAQAALAAQATTALSANTAVTAQNVSSVNGSVIAAGTVQQTALAPAVVTSLTGPVTDSRLSANVALRGSANTFTGDQTVNSGKLTVNGDATVTGNLRFGNSSQYSPALTVAGANLQMISGRLPALYNNSDPSLTASGVGWTAARYPTDLRFWRVTFTTAFATQPVVVTGWALASAAAMAGDSSPNIVTYNNGQSFICYGSTFGGNGAPLETHFIAIGAR
jgi:autotransporter-associated beta strand protein